MLSGFQEYLYAGNWWAGWRYFLTPTNDRSLAMEVKLLSSNHLVDVNDEMKYATVYWWSFYKYDVLILGTWP